MNRHICWLAAASWIVALPMYAGDGGAATLQVTVGKSLLLDTPSDLRRVAVADGEFAEALAVTQREVLINGKAPGETSVIIWQRDGVRTVYNLDVLPNPARVEAVQQELARALPGQPVSFDFANNTVFLRGTVIDLSSAERAVSMAATLGKVVNLLRVEVPAQQPQILLRVRFADVDRSATSALGINLLSTGAGNTVGQITTSQFGPAVPQTANGSMQWAFSDALNVFLFRPDLNLGTMIKALEAKNLLQMLAEPNLLAINGKPASFLAGGEFPFPVVQGGASVGSVTIQFREYGVRINFLPEITPRGSIRLRVSPEVSSLDYSNALQFQGFTIPALATRRVDTQVELASGQSFVIAGLLDNTITETLNKIPGIGDIPVLGKLFQSRARTRSNSELMVLVTPELVQPIPAGAPVPAVKLPEPFLQGTSKTAPRTPGADVTGALPHLPVRQDIPIEELLEIEKKAAAPAPVTGSGPAGPAASGEGH
ncbi:MAG TPA: pilus assembly protein N-terminal domain-containing protein [Bryobacteraceae bacterium]|nr:pilus assembly protein N-terminal domain-containing protein [Bryobacteraceae bacterium]